MRFHVPPRPRPPSTDVRLSPAGRVAGVHHQFHHLLLEQRQPPSVGSRMSLDALEDSSASPCPCAVANKDAPCRPESAQGHDRHFHHQVVEELGLSRAACHLRARFVWNTARWCRRVGSFRRWLVALRHGNRSTRNRDAAHQFERLAQAVSMPKARQSTLSSVISSRSSFSHWITVRSAWPRFPPAQVPQRRIGDHEADHVLRQMARMSAKASVSARTRRINGFPDRILPRATLVHGRSPLPQP